MNELKTTCKNPLCWCAYRPSGKFRSAKLNSSWKTDNMGEQIVKLVWILLNKSFAAAPLSLFFVLVFYTRVHLYMLYIVYATAF